MNIVDNRRIHSGRGIVEAFLLLFKSLFLLGVQLLTDIFGDIIVGF
jgi:hypothetical protein